MFSSKNLLRNDAAYPTYMDKLLPVAEEFLRSNNGVGARSRQAIEELRTRAVQDGLAEGKAEGFQSGYEAGLAAGKEAFDAEHQQEIEEFATRLQAFVTTAEVSLQEWYRAAEENLTTLAIDIARQALKVELETSRDSILEITKQALAEVTPGSKVRLRCNPWDGSIIDSRKHEITRAISGIQGIEIVNDPAIMGGCIVETESGAVDATIELFLDRLEGSA